MRLYDETDPSSIEEHGRRLVSAGTLAAAECEVPITDEESAGTIGARNRSAFGALLERNYYGISPGSSPLPDFPEAGVELKSHPLKRHAKNGYQAKERLVLNIINYKDEAGRSFEESSFSRKNADIMLVSFEHEDGRAAIEHPVRIAKRVRFSELPEKDRLIIRKDWERIQEKIASGKAHELSEADTDYLSACTKSATSKNRREQAAGGPPAKPRAYSLKPGYMSALSLRILKPDMPSLHEPIIKDRQVEELRTKTLEEIVVDKFTPFIGLDTDEIIKRVGGDFSKEPKHIRALLARRMLGIQGSKIEEFENAGIMMKTITLDSKGKPKEAMSFPRMHFQSVIHETWDGDPEEGYLRSELQSILERRFLFVVFQEVEKKRFVFQGVKFWNMPAADLDAVQPVWEETIEKIAASDMESVVEDSHDRIIHVRPHGKHGFDTDTLPDGTNFSKSCFWFNKSYLARIIRD